MISEEKLYEAIGKKIRALRKKSKPIVITQDKLAERVGLKRTSIANIEKGIQSVSVYLIYQISNALNVSVDELLPNQTDIQNDEKIIKVGDVFIESNSSDYMGTQSKEILKRIFNES